MAMDFILGQLWMVVRPRWQPAGTGAVQGWKGPRGLLMNDDISPSHEGNGYPPEHYPSEKHVFVLINAILT